MSDDIESLRDELWDFEDTEATRRLLMMAVVELRGIRRELTAPQRPDAVADVSAEDAARLDWLDDNVFHREMGDWDARFRPAQEMWVMFAPLGAQGSARKIIDAARAAASLQTAPATTPATTAERKPNDTEIDMDAPIEPLPVLGHINLVATYKPMRDLDETDVGQEGGKP